MKNPVAPFILAALVFAVCAVSGQAEPSAAEPEYRLDPDLSGEVPRPFRPAAVPPVVIDKVEDGANVHLVTETPLAPYLGAGQGPELSPEEVRLLQNKLEGAPLQDYRLEAGIGLYAEDKASLMLGYRFNNPPSLLDQRREDPLDMSGELRITFGLKLPFD